MSAKMSAGSYRIWRRIAAMGETYWRSARIVAIWGGGDWVIVRTDRGEYGYCVDASGTCNCHGMMTYWEE